MSCRVVARWEVTTPQQLGFAGAAPAGVASKAVIATATTIKRIKRLIPFPYLPWLQIGTVPVPKIGACHRRFGAYVREETPNPQSPTQLKRAEDSPTPESRNYVSGWGPNIDGSSASFPT